ncbi:uncharacterized protein FOMMEDRAFT_143178 [Fomitiporia mediterranea MF3/22]|uniref:uncharacterized protein n=1 Tax=Fomitiporia mediterranea (strain MF3/22) TaxID=694068 RepID=UPI0004408766|nr:uncharacterized protein FOMMEDRAFT_143178 [Fomitiporia mediterranea MF3/22]EJC98828.1 hypothetical protein FOMMEDRAFT_143178 [Fomitiporia mediterranea MF3/22]
MSFFKVGNSLASIASSSKSSHCLSAIRSTAALHTSAVRLAESQKQRTARLVRRTNIEKKAERARTYAENRPHPVLGTRPGEEEKKWRKSDLAKILVTSEELGSLAPTPLTGNDTEINLPEHTSYGMDGLDGVENRKGQLEFFFKHLPDTSLVAEVEQVDPDLQDRLKANIGNPENLSIEDQRHLAEFRQKEMEKARQLARIVDLRNANARGIAFENRRRIIAAFSPTQNANDSGYPEVQVALLTMKIRNLWSHLMERKKDVHSRRSLRLLVHQRAKMLKYIKHMDRDRYDTILQRVGLEAEAVEGEVVV